MKRRQDIRKELGELMSHSPSGDPHQNQMKRLQVLNAEVLLEVVDTLDKIDENNKELGDSNIKIQKWMVGLTILILLVALLTLLVAFKTRGTMKV